MEQSKTRRPQPFNAWLRKQHRRNDPVGDLSRDMRRDDEWPRSSVLPTLEAYLSEKDAAAGALDGLKSAHDEWRWESEAAHSG